MSILEAILLGIVQGLTEFLPVSSSGHLILTEKLLGIRASSLAFDVALHAGTLMALIIFFRHDIARLIKAVKHKTHEARIARLLLIATLPAVLVGLGLEGLVEDTFRSMVLVAVNLIFVAIFMLIAERQYGKRKDFTKLNNIRTKQALVVGLAQALAIIPGVSRSGSTITAGLLGGMDRVSATRFSFLLGIPITFGALLKMLVGGEGISQVQNDATVFLAGICAALLSGIFAIRFLINFLSKYGLTIFAYYRIVLGIVVLFFVFIG